MKRRGFALFTIGVGLGGLLGSIVTAYEAIRYLQDVPDLHTALLAEGISQGVFIVPVVVLAVGLVLGYRSKSAG